MTDTADKVYIGVAWPYASGSIHLGHMAGALLPADIFSRYCRMKGCQVLMVSGSDMHGTPITVEAEKRGVAPAKLAMENHESIVKSLHDTDIDFDLYTHTDTPNHHAVTHDIFLRALEKGHVEKRTMRAAYCPRCGQFRPDRYVEGKCPECGADGARGDQCDECGKTYDQEQLVDPVCKICKTPAEFRDTEHFFFRWSDFEEPLRKWVEGKSHTKTHVLNFTKKYLDEGLIDSAITRDIPYGISVPVAGYEGKTVYVWFEAVIGYLSASKQYFSDKGQPDGWKAYWEDPEARHYYFIGKDNIPFHMIRWPAVLMAYGGLDLPYDVPANQYLRWDDEKFSKSRGVGMDVPSFLARYDKEALRFYLSVAMPENKDTNFTLEDFAAQVNNSLLASLGNFIHRTLVFTAKNFGEVPPRGQLSDDDLKLLAALDAASASVDASLSRTEFAKGLKSIMAFCDEANRYFNAQKPWELVKNDRARCGTVLNVAMQAAKGVTVMLNPYIPSAAQRSWVNLGEEGSVQEAGWDAYKAPVREGAKLVEPAPLFKKVEVEVVRESPLAGLDVRVGQILSVEDHPQAEKLYILQLDMGDHKRQLVAGLRPYYAKEEMLGRRILVVCNLKHAKLRGATSEGMLLAGDNGAGVVSLLTPPGEAKPGDGIDGMTKGAAQVTIDQFAANHLVIGTGTEERKADVGRMVALASPHLGSRVFLVTAKEAYPLTVGGKPVGVHREVPNGSKVR